MQKQLLKLPEEVQAEAWRVCKETALIAAPVFQLQEWKYRGENDVLYVPTLRKLREVIATLLANSYVRKVGGCGSGRFYVEWDENIPSVHLELT